MNQKENQRKPAKITVLLKKIPFKKKSWIWIFSILFLLSSSSLGILLFLQTNSKMGIGKNVEFKIQVSESLGTITQRLKKEKLIRSSNLAYIYAKIRLWQGDTLQMGLFAVNDSMSTIEMIDLFFEGYGRPEEIAITFPEGYNIFEMAKLLKEKGLIAEEKEFLDRVHDPKLLSQNNITGDSLEGFLYPTTYFVVPYQKNIDSLIDRMIENFYRNFPYKEWKQYQNTKNNSSLSFYEMIILASLIEKETAIASERGFVSSVYHNRLQKKMKLQCDPTVIYALLRLGKYQGNLSRKRGDLSVDSPYNSYLYKGLPPSPIANPRKDSILSAIQPEKTSYLFFVAQDNRRHVFARNLTEHNRNVRKYRDWYYNNKKKTQ